MGADADGVKALKIFARSRAVIDYRPFATEAARRGKTIEIDFKVENPSDASKDIITIAENNVGLRVSGENVSFFSQSMQESSTQDVPIDNGVRIRLTVVVMPDAYGNAGFNIVAIYINGKKNRQYATRTTTTSAMTARLCWVAIMPTSTCTGCVSTTVHCLRKPYRRTISTSW